MLVDLGAVLARKRSDGAGSLRDLTDVGCREQQPEVASLSQLVEADQTCPQAWRIALVLLFQGDALRVESCHLRAHLRRLSFNLSKLLCTDLAFHLEAPQFTEQRALVSRQLVGLGVQRSQAGRRTLRQTLGLGSIRLLRAECGTRQHERGGGGGMAFEAHC